MNNTKIPGLIVIYIVLAMGFAGMKVQATLSPINLRCALRVNPLGIGDVNPRLSWQLQTGGQRGEVQSAYQVQVGTSPGVADLWDSGKVSSGATVDVLYGGQPLTSGEKCYWQVRVYDGSNNVSAWSAPAQWSMGLLSPSDWTAQWIGYDAAYNLTPGQAANNALFNTSGLNWVSYSGQTAQSGVYESSLRKQIILQLGQTFTNSVMALYADNFCIVYVNGQQMGTNSAGTNSVARWEATARINVTPWLHAGTNELALAATSSDAQESASVIGRLVVQFTSGSVSNIPVDTSWKAASWPRRALGPRPITMIRPGSRPQAAVLRGEHRHSTTLRGCPLRICGRISRSARPLRTRRCMSPHSGRK